ncbi:uncharacterized protein IUM83_06184 [Phytophthora cinnamomi]|uniref:uncharacterized protein n=1 Tax=Phytophthora cinnamomi TaxID=4785 RepID=UPI00355A0637|nr:hypothetical protein IUM83_06184 [Phytophthora cinnamomi]
MIRGCTKLNSAQVKLEVIFVDGWERVLHFLPSGECIHSSVPKTHHVLHCEVLDTQLPEEFETTFESGLHEAQQSKKAKRRATTNWLGHQKAPQFIAAVVHRSVALVNGRGDENSFVPNGGTTDVGQHTGGRPRDTCWALVKEAIERNLCCGNGLFRKTMSLFELSLLQSEMEKAPNVFCANAVDVKSGCDWVDDMFFMLQVVVQHVIELLEDGYEVESFQEQCA